MHPIIMIGAEISETIVVALVFARHHRSMGVISGVS